MATITPDDFEVSVPSHEPAPYFIVSLTKLALMSFFTLGLYQLYWFYRNWQLERSRTGQDIWPFWRAFFSVIWCYSLLDRIKTVTTDHHIDSRINPVLATIIYIALTIAYQLPGDLWYLSLLSFLPLLAVQHEVIELNRRQQQEHDPNGRITGWNLAAMSFGALVLFGGYILPGGADATLLESLPVGGRYLQLGAMSHGDLEENAPSRGAGLGGKLYLQAWLFQGYAGEKVSIDLVSHEFDAYLLVTGPGLAQVLEDDDSGGACHARITFVPKDSGNFRVVVSSSLPNQTGTYTLTVFRQPGPLAPGDCPSS